MKTVNISLTEQQTQAIDQVVTQMGFANRSEFFRTLLRVFLRKPEVLSENDFIFSPPDTKSARNVLDSFKDSGKYSQEFLNDLEDGLKNSTYFNNDLPQADK